MNSFLVFMIIILIIILFLGVINPKVEINKSTRLKVFLIWLFFAFIVTIIAIPKNNVRKSDIIEEASSLIENGEYSEAKRILLKVKEDNKYNIDAKGLIKKSDSLKMIDERAKIEAKEIEEETAKLIADDDVERKSGIYPYILTRDERFLGIRAFTESMKQKAYEKQKGICPVCNNHYEIEEMEGDHIIPWKDGGKTEESNLQMLCKMDNRRKSGS